MEKLFIVKYIEDGNILLFPTLDSFKNLLDYILIGFVIAEQTEACIQFASKDAVVVGDVAAAYGGGKFIINDVVYYGDDHNIDRAIRGKMYVVPKNRQMFFKTLITQKRYTKLQDSYGAFVVDDEELNCWRNGQKIEARAKLPAEKLIVGSSGTNWNLKVEDFDGDGDIGIVPVLNGSEESTIYLDKGGVNELIKYLTKCLKNA